MSNININQAPGNFVQRNGLNNTKVNKSGNYGRSSNFRGRGRNRGRGGRITEHQNPCQIYGLNSHSASWCFNRYDERYMGNRPKKQNGSNNNSTPSAFVASPSTVEDPS
ncbi:hypothetical protein Adt_31724 [Abeliophyllum distichum]|uniref:Uncharacterized protein n=1 Tax=Abeliophyllum distichum TaxID=126358 RepID=A0ABD1RGQ2_9LAMI